MALTELLILRIVHVLGGTFWVGGMLLTTFFLMPSMREAGPAAAPVMAGFQKRKLMVVMPTVAFLTILSGFRLIWIVSGGFEGAFFATSRGMAYSIGGGLALLAFLIGISVNRPANLKMATLSRSLATAEPAQREALMSDLARLRRRLGQVNLLVASLVVLATIGMAIGRYI